MCRKGLWGLRGGRGKSTTGGDWRCIKGVVGVRGRGGEDRERKTEGRVVCNVGLDGEKWVLSKQGFSSLPTPAPVRKLIYLSLLRCNTRALRPELLFPLPLLLLSLPSLPILFSPPLQTHPNRLNIPKFKSSASQPCLSSFESEPSAHSPHCWLYWLQ